MLKIVVVDDNLQFVSVLENFLQDKPDILVVGTASDGWHGLELIEEHRPDVVLLDMIMPRLGIPKDKYINHVKEWGNMISASIPYALCDAIHHGQIVRGNVVMLIGTAAGLTSNVLVLKF